MSEENISQEIPLATLEEGESLIPAEKLEEYNAVVEEILSTEETATEVAAEEKKTTVEEVAEDLGIEVSTPVAVEEAANVVSSPKASAPSKPRKPALGTVNGAIGSTGADRKAKPAPAVATTEPKTVAVYSSKNISWTGVGKLRSGYNILTEKQAEHWLTRKVVRLATPEEVAKEFNK